MVHSFAQISVAAVVSSPSLVFHSVILYEHLRSMPMFPFYYYISFGFEPFLTMTMMMIMMISQRENCCGGWQNLTDDYDYFKALSFIFQFLCFKLDCEMLWNGCRPTRREDKKNETKIFYEVLVTTGFPKSTSGYSICHYYHFIDVTIIIMKEGQRLLLPEHASVVHSSHTNSLRHASMTTNLSF